MKAQINSIGSIALLFEPLNIGGTIGMGSGNNDIILAFDDPNQIEYLIHGLNELSNSVAEAYNAMQDEESAEAKNDEVFW